MSLHLPDPALLTPDRIVQVLLDLGVTQTRPPPAWLTQTVACCAWVVEVDGEPVPTWSVQDQRVRYRATKRGDPVALKTLVCSCGGSTCPHLAATLVVLAFNDPRRAASLREPAWAIALAPLVPEPLPKTAPPHGHVRYDLVRPSPGRPGLEVTATLVLRSRTDGTARKPLRAPTGLADLRRKISGLTPLDLQLHPALLALQRARVLERGKDPAACRHLSRTLIPLLAQAGETTLEGEPIHVSARPILPRIHAAPTADGGLTLRWEPPLRCAWRDSGVAVTRDGTLCLIDEALPAATLHRLGDPLPAVPAADVEAFVDRMVVERGLDVDLPPELRRVHAADERAARIALAERDGVLHVTLELAYTRGGVQAVVAPHAPGATLPIAEHGQIRRDPVWERAQCARFTEDVGDPTGRALELDDAVAFLRTDLPHLATRWPIFGQDSLTRVQVRGTLAPAVRFTEGQDWFDLEVRFELGGRQVAATHVLQSWLRGARYHRLDDGSLARLPQRWLDKHATQVDALEEVRREQSKLSSWHAWLASDLLQEAGAEHWLQWTADVDTPRPVPVAAPGGLQATLRPYQIEGLRWLCFLRDHGLHGILADEMGLGKTLQALAAIVATPSERPSLVVAPTSVLHGWRDEAARFAPGLHVRTWHGAQRDPAMLRGPGLVVTSYALLRRDQALLAGVDWCWAVLDEGQAIKNPASQTARAARRLVAAHRLILSGTPLENDLTELWSLLAFLLPGYLGRRSAFQARYGRSSRDADAPATRELAERIRPFLLRRRKVDVAPELPPRSEVTVRVPLSQGERRLYDSVRLTVMQAMDDPELSPRRRQSMWLEGLTRLRQACCHPGLLPFPEARSLTGSAKLTALLHHLDGLADGSRCLVFSQWTGLLDRVAERLDARGEPHLRLQGDTRNRGAVVAAFQAPDGPRVFLISIKAGGTGLNLTAADTVFLLDPWWNPQVEAQATDRAHRIGQQRPVTVFRLVAADTVEDRVLKLQQHKRRLFEEAVGGATLDVDALTTAELQALLAVH